MKTIQGMPCPQCGDMNVPVRHSGHDIEGNRVRRRDCANCGHHFTTVEVAVPASFFRLTQPTRETKSFPHSEKPDFIATEQRGKNQTVVVVRRARPRSRTCRRGLHVLTDENMIQWRSKKGQCRHCYNEARRETYHAKRAMGLRRIDNGSWVKVA